MLTQHERTSRKRLLTGGGAIAALMLASLAVTASGTQAAERMRSGIETTTGVDLASLELPALPQVPPTPPASDVAPAPPAPPAPEITKRKHRMVVIRDKDGKVTTREFSGADNEGFVAFAGVGKDGDFDMRELARLKDIPTVSSGNCNVKDGNGSEAVIHTRDGNRQKIVICTNRIERQARIAADSARVASVDVVRIQRDAKASALAGLERARASVERAQDMADARRETALKAIDKAIDEMRSDED